MSGLALKGGAFVQQTNRKFPSEHSEMQTFKKTTVAAAIVLSMSAFAAQADETATSTPTNPTLAEFQKGFSGQTFTDDAFTIANSAAVDPGAQLKLSQSDEL